MFRCRQFRIGCAKRAESRDQKFELLGWQPSSVHHQAAARVVADTPNFRFGPSA